MTVGQTFDHAIRRTVAELDNLLVATLTYNPAALLGDTLRIEIEVADRRESKSRPDAGIVTFLHCGYTQRGTLGATCKRSGLQRKEPA